jgi:hypothetical protein
MDQEPTQKPDKNRYVEWVKNTLHSENYHTFIRRYIENYDKFERRGEYFRNFLITCQSMLLGNDNYKHYNMGTEQCQQTSNGPKMAYSGLLKHITHNAKGYSKEDARKIHKLLFLFESQGISFNIIIPLDVRAKQMFIEYRIKPGYTEKSDGTLKYCSVSNKVHHNGMEISNTRVNALISKIHDLKDDDDADDDDDDDDVIVAADADADADAGAGAGAEAGGKRRSKSIKNRSSRRVRTRTSRTTRRRRRSSSRRRLSTKRTTRRTKRTTRSTKRTTRRTRHTRSRRR